MSIYDKASLVLIPSGTKTSKVYSQKPVNGDGDFTFSRSTAATRVNADGNIEKETQNLLTYSNTFSNSDWANSRTTDTSGQSGYDGTNNAWLLESTATAQSASIFQGMTKSFVHTISVYAKAGTSDWVALFSAGNQSAYFDLANGVVGSTSGSNVIDSNIEQVGAAGWYRCSITLSGNDNAYIFIANGDNNGTTNSGDNIYIQDAQVERGLVARDYIETTTTAVEGGITDNVPRLDYTDASCPSLLLEPQRTNLCIQSEYAGSWATSGVGSVTDNDQISPEGLQNAFTLNDTSSGAYYRKERNVSVSAGDNTLSVFLKKTTGALSYYAGVQLDISRKYVIIDTTNGTWNEDGSIANDFIDVEDFSADYWRVIITNDLSAGSSRVGLWSAISANGTSISATATGSNVFYGVQLEAGSYATSYIPTYGSAVTRNGETCLDAGNANTLDSTEGVLYTELSRFASSGVVNYCAIGLNDGTSNNEVVFKFRNSINTFYTTIKSSNGNTRTDLSHTFNDLSETTKIAIKYKINDFALWVNGVEVRTSNNANTPIGMDTFNFASATLSEPFYGNVNQVLIFNTALTDEELADLTTI